jgi:hypothetical protein
MAMNKQREMRFGVFGRFVRDSTSLSQMAALHYRGDLGRLVPDSLQLSPMPPSGTLRKLF